MLAKFQPRRGLGRQRAVFPITVVVILMYWFLLKAPRYRTLLSFRADADFIETPSPNLDKSQRVSVDDEIMLDKPLSFQEIPPAQADNEKNLEREAKEKENSLKETLRTAFRNEYDALKSEPGAGSIYEKTLEDLIDKENRIPTDENTLTLANNSVPFSFSRPYVFNPYPNYNSPAWRSTHANYTACRGPKGANIDDILVFKGRPRDFPEPGFGSYDVLGIDQNVCFERETRLGRYEEITGAYKDDSAVNWEDFDWGKLQIECLDRNKERFKLGYELNVSDVPSHNQPLDLEPGGDTKEDAEYPLRSTRRYFRRHAGHQKKTRSEMVLNDQNRSADNATMLVKEKRTALLLRSYTGKEYTDNDKQVLRSLITELSLRTGGEYEVFLLVHVKDGSSIWLDDATYETVIQKAIPQEFWGITVLWDDESVKTTYPKLNNKAVQVHNAQFLSVQMFMEKRPEFDFVWNWELDSRLMGHHYDFVTKLADFARKQPRKGLWERSERFYIPDFHGEYPTDFRTTVEQVTGNESIWGAPNVPGSHPIGPKPPVPTPKQDDYEWGVGEDADLITLSPMFNPNNSNWILRDQVWGYSYEGFSGTQIPRRAAIITQSRISRRLIDIMHAETLRGNHVGSEMVAPTVALLHGLKAVYAPMPVFFDRPWKGAQLARWFNGGPKGESGSFGSAMGWGQEGRFQGSTWYFRANPPQRLYNNWMGYEDTGVGGAEWEKIHGRPCLPTMLLHPIKDVRPTAPGTSSESKLPYG
ncbi:hypothetical protein B0T17DRAFT_619589 [Bombardia bombarda]|uniref:Major facilitator superfamily transporter n=1 Tax=Bombardia bombarda TaxID=252184 RepID=A0AA39WIH1_9PEZI|nr:hypothetical protein B0T17DRAFT_619589 [Bombardia bombarda]